VGFGLSHGIGSATFRVALGGGAVAPSVSIVSPGTVYAGVAATVTVTATGAVDRVVLTEVGASEAWDDSSAPFAGDWTPSTSGTRTLHADGYAGAALVATDEIAVPVTAPTMITTGDTTMALRVTCSSQITIAWGDGTSNNYTGTNQNATHTYTDGKATHGIKFSGALGTLTYLLCNGNSLHLLDATQLPALTDLNCITNSIPVLDMSQCPDLVTLTCYSNALTSVDVTQCPDLATLNGANNAGLTSLDVSQNPALVTLGCNTTGLTSLDVSGNPALASLVCYGCGWSQAVVDQVLVDVAATVAANPRTGTLQIHTTNSAPSAGTGCPAKASLEAAGWTVTITGTCS
jgi:hypothetical protein